MYILTGGAGFIGSCFLEKLNSQGINNILVVDNLASSSKWKNLRNKNYNDYLHKSEFLQQIKDNKLTNKIDYIIHLGACSSTTETNADYMMENNFQYTKTLASWALKNNIKMLYASSAATYGDGSQGFNDDDNLNPKLSPLNVYGYSKLLFDLWALKSGAIKNLIGVRFFNVFGPNEYHKGEMASVIYKSHQQILKQGNIELFKSYKKEYADGEQKRDFIYVKDCCDALWWMMNQHNLSGIFNLGTAKERSWNDLAKAAFSAQKKPVNIQYIEMPEYLRDKYQYFTEAKMDKLLQAGYTGKFRSLEESIEDYICNYLLVDKYL
ncbi:MAG: ADP-glyceromanno-heptose 6-epimerase [Proteobacteria bacterium]|nr:ADP-glyceromanno-heptose 6-epimerase [Pseudomonadota bacterium]